MSRFLSFGIRNALLAAITAAEAGAADCSRSGRDSPNQLHPVPYQDDVHVRSRPEQPRSGAPRRIARCSSGGWQSIGKQADRGRGAQRQARHASTKALSPAEIDTLRRWIDQGAAWADSPRSRSRAPQDVLVVVPESVKPAVPEIGRCLGPQRNRRVHPAQIESGISSALCLVPHPPHWFAVPTWTCGACRRPSNRYANSPPISRRTPGPS